MNQKNKKITLLIATIVVIVLSLAFFLQKKTDSQIGGESDVSESGELIPTISSINPSSGPVGTVIEIRGKNVEPSVVIFKSKTGNNVTGLRDNYLDRTVLNNDSVNIIVKDPCVKDEVVFYRFMTNTHRCDQYGKLIPGVYEVYLTTEERESNRVEFTITAQ